MAIVTLTVDDDGVALITLDDPARAANVTSPELTAELLAAIDRVAADEAICGAVIASGKPGRFVAGGDIKDFVGAWERGMTEAQAFEFSHAWNRDLRRIEHSGKPFAAAINGAALGGGFELALLCHHRVVVDDPKALVGLVEVGIGLLPAGGGSQRLPRLIGIDAAMHLMIDARRLAPHEALAAGLVDAVVPADRLVEQAREWVREWVRGSVRESAHESVGTRRQARQPWEDRADAAPDMASYDVLLRHWQREVDQRFGDHYPAPAALLRAVFDGVAQPLDGGLRTESLCFAPLLPGVVARNLMRTGFVYRQQADKSARQAASRVEPAGWPELDGSSATDCALPHLLLWPDAEAAVLAELVRPAAADAEDVEAALAQAARRGVTPVVLPAGQASFVRRLHRCWSDEALSLQQQGQTPAAIEAAARRTGLRLGGWWPWPTGGDGVASAPVAHVPQVPQISQVPPASPVLPVSPALPVMPGPSVRSAAEDPPAVLPLRPVLHDAGTRLLAAAQREGARALADGGIASAADADLASVLGAGCPAWTGGVISVADTLRHPAGDAADHSRYRRG